MRITATRQGSLSEALDTAKIIHNMAVLKGITQGAGRLKDGLRSDTIAAGLSERLARTWQLKIYPNRGRNPAGLVYSKAPKIISSFARGATIVPTGGRRFLAIPTDQVGRKRQGNAMTPNEVEARFGRKLRFVPARGAEGSRIGSGKAVGYLVLDNVVSKKSNGRLRNASPREINLAGTGKARPVQSVVMFTLVASVTMRKVFDLKARADLAGVDTAQLIAGAIV